MHDTRQIGQMLLPGMADFLPVMERGGAGRYLSLGLSDEVKVCLALLLQGFQVLLGWFELLLDLPRLTEDGQRIALYH